MTNERIAEIIAEGDGEELLPILWEKMRRFYKIQCDKYYRKHKDRCIQCGVTVDDLMQESYISMLDSIKAYGNRKPEQSELTFTSFCSYPFKNAADRAISIGSRGNPHEPLNTCTTSLDEPIGDGEDKEVTRIELVPDTEAEEPYRDIEQSDYCRAIRETAKSVLDSRLWDIIDRRYFKGETLRQAAENLGVTFQRVRQLETRALQKLRYSKEMRDSAAISVYKHIGVSECLRGGSIVERATEQEEKRRIYDEMLIEILGRARGEQEIERRKRAETT